MTLDISTHRNILIMVVKEIFSDPLLCSVLGFKGGTAAYFVYSLERFSVDLDFDLLEIEKKNDVFERMKNVLGRFGVLKESKSKKSGFLFVLSYPRKTEGAQNVKVEINLKDFGSKYAIRSFLGISVKIMVKEDMLAHKMVAMYERIGKANRDIYDIWFFLKNNWDFNGEIIENRTGMSAESFLKKLISELKRLPNTGILSGIGELLDSKQKQWVKANLLADTIFLLRLRLDTIGRSKKF